MKILQLCKKFPFPPKDGESIAINNLSKALVDLGSDVDLLAMNTAKHHVNVENYKSEEQLAHYSNIYTVEVDNRLKPWDAFNNLVKGKSYHISRFESSRFNDAVVKLLKNNTYDIIQLETVYLAPYLEIIRKYSDAMVAMRAHNVEHEIWEKISKNTTFPIKKWYLSHLSKQLKDFEIDYLNRYDFLVAISEQDLKKFKRLGYKNGAIASPVGLNFEEYNKRPFKVKKKLRFNFIGSLDWMPNLHGLKWFLNSVWPQFDGRSVTELHIAGRNTPQEIKTLNCPTIQIHGEVKDAIQFIGDNDVMVVPLFSGSGMRVKILEGMALGKVIITTTKGLEGIHATSGEHVLIANTAEEFIHQMNWCLENRKMLNSIGDNARRFIHENFDSLGVAQNLLNSYHYIISDAYLTK